MMQTILSFISIFLFIVTLVHMEQWIQNYEAARLELIQTRLQFLRRRQIRHLAFIRPRNYSLPLSICKYNVSNNSIILV
jgi:hypothetical protein